MKKDMLKNLKNPICIIVILLLLVVTSVSMRYKISFEYADTSFAGSIATLYYDYGDGFTEDLSAYAVIEDDTVTFPLKQYLRIRGIRFVAVRENGKIGEIVSAKLKIGTLCVEKISAEKLQDNLLDSFNATIVEDRILIEKLSDESYDFLDFSSNLFSGTNKAFLLICILMRMINCVLFALLGLIAYYVGLYVYGKSKDGYVKYKKYFLEIMACAMAVEYFLAIEITAVVPLLGFILLFFIFGSMGLLWNVERNVYAVIVLSFLTLYIYMTDPSWNGDGILLIGYLAQQFLLAIIAIGLLNSYRKQKEDEKFKALLDNDEIRITGLYLKVVLVYIGFDALKNILIKGSYHFLDMFGNSVTQVALINITWMFFLILLLYFVVGNGIANVVFWIFSSILFLGNYIKITYHDTYLTPMDFWQITDMLRISRAIVNNRMIIISVIIVVSILVLIIRFRKRLKIYLKPHVNLLMGCLALIITVFSTKDFLKDRYLDKYNIGYKWYITEYEGEETSGTYLYNMFNIVHMKDNAVEKPADYTEEYAKELLKEFESCKKGKVTETKPNVICIMAESLFDIENIKALTFDQEIEPTIHKYMKSTLISPRFGGYTAAVEYEALTGHSLFFYKEGTMPYTTYYTNSRSVNSVASEFKKSGYTTLTFHPNIGSFYARKRAYSLMDFDNMYTIDDMDLSESDLTGAGYCRDIPFAEKVEELAESQDEPVFLFGVSIAGHYTSEDHYSYTDVDVQVDGETTAEDDHILEQMAMAYRESDEMVQMLIDYVDSCDEPTILYVFGDHLPPLPMYDKLNYIEDPTNKYGTVFLGYSNYKDIEFPDYMTPNQLGAQMLIDAEVDHSSYWDYIFSLREKFPVIQKEFISEEDAKQLEKYKFIQYDLMFGKSWILANDN